MLRVLCVRLAVWLVFFCLLFLKEGDRCLTNGVGSAESPCDSVPLFKRSILPQIKLLSVLQIRTGLQFLAVESIVEVFPATVF